MNLDGIPKALRERDQWLTWDSSTDRKQPYWGEKKVSWSDPDSWHSFAEALAKADKRESWGVGYVTAANNDDHPMGVMSVIDLDGAADENDTPKDWVPDFEPFAERDAYIEWSQSHDDPGDSGLHIPIAGSPPEWWADVQAPDGDHEGIDLLANKFCIFTGDQLRETGSEIPGWDDEIETWLADAYEALTDETAPPRRSANGSDSGGENTASTAATDGWEVDEETAEAMLDEINANCSYEQWRNIGFALADHFTSSTAKRLFDEWSRGGSKYDDDAERLIEDIANRGSGDVTIATLVHHATNAGWEPSFGGEEYEGTPTARELVARHSDEYDAVSEVPEDIFETEGVDDAELAKTSFGDPDEYERDTAPQTAETDGGAVAADTPTDTDAESSDSKATGGPWEHIYTAYKGAEDADERLPARYEATEQLDSESHWRALVENDQLWKYHPEKGIYENDGDVRLRERLVEKLAEQYKAHEQSEIAEQLRGRNTVSQRSMGGPEGLIAAENCVINLLEETTEPHSPEHNFMSRLGCAFDADAGCPRWRAFLNEVVDSEMNRQKLQEFAGYTLHHWEMPHHKALFLVGPTASGKSTFLDTINAMLGDGTTSSLTPQQMTSERFGGAELFNKWANIRNDIPASTVENTGAFKEIVGGDPLKAEAKYEDPFMFRPKAKHLFSANQLPEADTDDEAFFRRILLVPFPETVPKGERDPMLDEKLQDELPGILNWALEGLQRLLANGGFTGDRSPGHTRDTWEKWGNSVLRFQDAALDSGGESIPKHEVYAAYLEYCRQESIPTETQNMLTRKLKKQGFEDGRSYVDGSRERVFMNIAWTGRGEELLEDASDRGGDDDSDHSPSGLSGFGE